MRCRCRSWLQALIKYQRKGVVAELPAAVETVAWSADQSSSGMLRVLCLGCGNGLNTNLAESLKAIFRKRKYKFKLVMSSIKVGKHHTKKVKVEEQAKNGDFDIIVAMPGFGTFSRARHSRGPGPRPARSKDHPFGIPGRGFRATQATRAET